MITGRPRSDALLVLSAVLAAQVACSLASLSDGLGAVSLPAARLLGAAAVAAAPPAQGPARLPSRPESAGATRPVPEAIVHEVASQLRCVVCQNLSVADSPSEMANQMRDIVRQRLATGETPEQVMRYFVDRYGEWILLSPAPHGLNLLVWAAPAIAVLIGLAAVAYRVRRWTRPARTTWAQPVDPALRERVRQELEQRR